MISFRVNKFLRSYKRPYTNTFLFKSDIKKIDKLVYAIHAKLDFMKIKIMYYNVIEVFEADELFEYIYNHFDGYKFDEESSYMLNELHRIHKEQHGD